MNPRETTDKIRSDYKEYLASIISVKDKEIADLSYDAIYKTDFVKGPFLETTLPFVEGKSLKALAEEGVVSQEFAKMGHSVHYDEWKLRIHQEKALRHIIEKQRNMIVSTGTGSGKTECYLYPIFNELMREKEKNTLDPGVRALLIFPMNALANDQQKKLRKLLRSYPDITFGRYTGETEHKGSKETAEEAEMRLHETYDSIHKNDNDPDLRSSIPNELMCREMMAKTPPHILLTNYAMLEYMLLQPDTAPFFDNNSAQHWRFIVIDEAHTYKGATGTEIAFLLRRLKERIRHNMHDDFRCIATSATLGSEDGKEDLAHFAQELFGEQFSGEDVITTQRILREKPVDGREFSPEDYKKLKESTEKLSEEEKGKILYHSLIKDLRLFRLYESLKNKPEKIESLACSVFPDIVDEKSREIALIELIELAAAARKSMNDPALLPARYHLFVKSLEGLFAQFIPKKNVFLDRRERVFEGDYVHSVFELANCQHCGQEYLVGKTINNAGKNFFVQTSNEEKPEFYFIPPSGSTDNLEEFDEDDEIEAHGNLQSLKKYNLCINCGRITEYSEKIHFDCCNDPDHKKIVTVYKLSYAGKGNESNCCPCCGSTKRGLIKRFLTANQPATFAVGKSLYDAIPPHPYQFVREEQLASTDDIFDDLPDIEPTDESQLLDESGRKLLVFSDNRQEAAFFAGFFEKKYRLIMWRKAILKVLREADKQELYIPDLINRVRIEAQKTGLYSLDIEKKETMTDDEKLQMAAHYVMDEFMASDVKTGLEGMGYVRITPDELQIRDSVTMAGLHGKEIWNALCYMMDTLRKKGVVTYPDEIRATDDFFAPRNHYGHFRMQRSSTEKDGFIYGFIPQDGTNNKRLALMIQLLTDPGKDIKTKQEEARKNLKGLYNLIVGKTFIDRNLVKMSSDAQNGTVYCLNYAKWKMKLLKKDDVLYRCKKCGMVFPYSIRGLCPEMKCDGELEEISSQNIRKVHYYEQIYSDPKLIPMVSREHTAQLSSKTAGDYQKLFEEGRINVLSCSTTFEMGVDVGELEAIFQRNVPPETSNYIQRAGRAGRRTSSAAFSVTFARRSSHDMTFFQDPPRIISGSISAPILEVKNEKIAQRHLNSIIVAWFFKKKPDYFLFNTSRIVAFDDGESMAQALLESLNEKPEDLLKSIHNVFSNTICNNLGVDEWKFIDDIAGPEGSLAKAIQERKSDIQGLKQLQKLPANPTQNEIRMAMTAGKLINLLEKESSINFLSAHGVLPKYGFPVDTVSLDILGGDYEESKKIDLSRDLRMAISEFAPPAEIVANGKVWKSYAIKTIPDKTWPAYYYYECPQCKHIYPPEQGVITITADSKQAEKKVCPTCHKEMNPKKFIIPKFGFTTSIKEAPKTVGDSRPKSYYSTQTQFWGIGDISEKEKSEALERTVNISGKNIEISYSPGGKLFVLNQGSNGRGLNVCPSCGFASDPATIIKGGKHLTAHGKICSTHLINVSLGHEFSTDILKIKLPYHFINLDTGVNIEKKDLHLSTLFAILEGASSSLEISRSDINGCVAENGEIILYDDTPGGSGFVKRIYEKFEEILPAALKKVNGQCGCTEETSCYGCLRNYSNQYYHDMLSRGLAYKYLDWIINQQEKEIREEHEIESIDSLDTAVPVGNRKLNISRPFPRPSKDTKSAIEYLASDCDDDDRKILEHLISKAPGPEYEWPYIDTQINSIWPSLFWFESKTAVFLPNVVNQYNKMKKYDWFCYMLDKGTNPEIIFSHIQKEK